MIPTQNSKQTKQLAARRALAKMGRIVRPGEDAVKILAQAQATESA